jgi:predicted chitinase
MWAVVTGAGLDEHPDDVSKESADLRQANLLSQVSHSAGGFTNLTLDSRNAGHSPWCF